jgi:hypothetical protein
MLEKDIESALVKRIKEIGGKAYKFTSPNRRSVPDRLVLLPGGRVLFVECKRPGCKPTKLQIAEHLRLQDLGFEVLVIDSVEQIGELK